MTDEYKFKIQSKFFTDLIYDEKSNKINSGDKKTQVSLYHINLFKQKIIISLGKINSDDYIGRGIITFPVYIITKDLTKIEKIGIYEIRAKHYPVLLDEEDDIKISYVDGPLFFNYFNEKYLVNFLKENEIIEIINESDDDESDDGEGDDDKTDSILNETGDFDPDVKPILQELEIEEDGDEDIPDEENVKNIKKIKKNYVKMEKDSWIKFWKKNNNFNIIDEGAGGDCLFLTIESAYKSLNIDMSVKKQRDLVSKNINDGQFKTYFELYTNFSNEIVQNGKKIKILEHSNDKMKSDHSLLIKKTKAEKDVPTRKGMIADCRAFKAQYGPIIEKNKKSITQLKNELKYAEENIEEVKFMKGIKSLNKLKEFVKTCDFWADSYVIHLLEEYLNTKIIILSKQNYDKGETNNVLLCSDMTSNKIEDRGVFKPKYYIMVEHSGDHYRLITYKDKKIFRYHEIPFDIKDLIVKKCMSSDGKNIYNYIPKFAKLIGITLIDKETEGEKEPTKEPAEEPAKEPAEEPAKEPAKEPVKEPAKEPAEEPEKKRGKKKKKNT